MKKLILTAALTLISGPVMAHTGHGETSGFLFGFVHPVLGADHLLAMLAVGLWSGFVLPKKFWAGALAFLSAMVCGAALGWAGIAFPMVEQVILASVVVFGLMTLTSHREQSKTATLTSLGVIALFASAHGHAHATEASGNALAYLAGFLTATTGLHLAGIAIVRAVSDRGLMQKALGLGIALPGLWLIAG